MPGHHPSGPLIGVRHLEEVLLVFRPAGQMGTATGDQVIFPFLAVPLDIAARLTCLPAAFPTEIAGKALRSTLRPSLFDVARMDVIERHDFCSLSSGGAELPLSGLPTS